AAEVWDTNALKVGNFGDQMTATFDQIKLEGENLGAAVASSLKGALDAYEDALAKFIVTGRGSVRQVVIGLEESLVKAGLRKGVASITGAVTGGGGGRVGLGGLFGSLGNIFKSLFGTGKAGGAPTANAVSDAKGSAFKANLGKLAKFDEGFQPQQKKSGGLFG